MKITFLGTGANGGVPQVDCRCKNCEATRKHFEISRLRSSVLVKTENGNIIFDCGPDFRQQLIRVNLRLPDISLIAVTHLHFDHIDGLMELSSGVAMNIPVLVSVENQVILNERDNVKFLIKNKYMHFATAEEIKRFGVKLIDIPHGGKFFPTSAIVVTEDNSSVLYSPDVARITPEMKRIMRKCDLVVFDSTFFDESNFPASSLGHITIRDSAPQLLEIGTKVIFSHMNHSESPDKVSDYLKTFGFTLANDGDSNII